MLFSSNFSFVLDVNPLWVRIRDKRRHYVGLDGAFEFDRYNAAAEKQQVLRDFVRAVRHLATTRPDLIVVVRPHPIEAEGAWEDLVGPVPNVLITRERSLNAWIRRATAVIKNGCTSGYETAVGGVLLISFHPNGILADHPVNMLGLRASTIEELDEQLDHILAQPDDWTERREEGAAELLCRRLSSRDGVLATDRIVDEWAGLELDTSPRLEIDRIMRGRRRVEVRRRAGAVRRRARAVVRSDPPDGAGAPTPFRIAHKFPPITAEEVTRVTTGLCRSLDRFEDITARMIAPDLVLFERR